MGPRSVATGFAMMSDVDRDQDNCDQDNRDQDNRDQDDRDQIQVRRGHRRMVRGEEKGQLDWSCSEMC